MPRENPPFGACTVRVRGVSYLYAPMLRNGSVHADVGFEVGHHITKGTRTLRNLEYRYKVGLVAALGLFMAVLDNTIVNVSLTAMQRSFNTTINNIQWVVTAYFLAQAAIIPAAGYLGNRFGLKNVFMLALGVFTVGSLLCGLSANFPQSGDTLLIAFRILQGIGGGMLFPLGTAISFSVFPPADRAKASGLIAVPVFIAPTLGPTIGGLIVDSPLAWPGIFYINIPVGIIAIFLMWRIYHPDRLSADGKAHVAAPAGTANAAVGRPGAPAAATAGFDWFGLISSIVGIVLVIYGFELVSETRPGTITQFKPRGDIYGWGYGGVWAFIVGGLAVLAAFAVYELRVAKDPVLDLRLFRNYNFGIASLLTWVTRAVVFGSFFLIPLFLQQFRGYTAVQTGLMLIPQGLFAGAAVVITSRLYDRIGARIIVAVGMILLTISSIMLIAIKVDSGPAFFIPIIALRGVGFGFSNLPLQTLALSAITGRALPKASSLYNATGQIFSSIGIAVLSTLLVQYTTSQAGDIIATSQANRTPPPANIAALAGAGAMSTIFIILSIGTGVAVLLSLLLPGRATQAAQAAQIAKQGHGAPQAVMAAE